MSRRRRRKNPFSLTDASSVLTLAAVGVGIYLLYSFTKGVTNAASSLTSGPAPGQSYLNYLFGVGGQGTLDASGNYVPPADGS